jgi:hypothetical protein
MLHSVVPWFKPAKGEFSLSDPNSDQSGVLIVLGLLISRKT